MRGRLVADFQGLLTAPGPFRRPPGAFSSLVNASVEDAGVVRSRRGWSRANPGIGTIWKMASHWTLGDKILCNYGSGASSGTYASNLGYFTTGTVTGITGTVTNQPNRRMMSDVGGKNVYLTSDEGVRRLETTLSLDFAGMPPGLGLLRNGTSAPAAILVGTGGFLPDGYACSYRTTICKKDAQGLVMEGEPMVRTLIKNAASTTGYGAATARNVSCRALLPKQWGTGSTALTTSYFLRVYRSVGAPIATTQPDEEHRLVFERFLTAGEITNGYVDFTDSTPDSLRGAPLHTNPLTGDDGIVRGMANANQPPPLAREVVHFADCMWYLECTELAQADATLVAVGGAGLVDGDTVVIDGVTYTARNAPALASEFGIYAAGTTTQNIEETALNLVECVNRYSSNTTHYAAYVSGAFEYPGRIRVRSRFPVISGSFAFACSRANVFRPDASGSGINVANQAALNRGYFSKPGQADAVPPVNSFNFGPADSSVLRAVPLDTNLFVFTERGYYRVTGTSFVDFEAKLIDPSFRPISREAIAVADDAIYAWGTQGLARITDSGTEYISDGLRWNVASAVDVFNKNSPTWGQLYCWAVAYQSDFKVAFFFPGSSSAQTCANAFVLDTRTRKWAIWQGQAYSNGVVRLYDDTLWAASWSANSSNGYLFQQRRNYSTGDYIDTDEAGTDSGISKTLQLTFCLPDDAPDAVHWQELHIEWERNEVVTGYQQPSTVTVQFTSNVAAATQETYTVSTGAYSTRIPVPAVARRGDRLQVRLTHSTQSAPFAITALKMAYGDDSSHRTTRNG